MPTLTTPAGSVRWPRLALGALLGTALIAVAVTGIVDEGAEAQYEMMLKRALITFAVARSLNGVISVIQETEVALQPAGVGVKLAPGQILDPVNDLVEQFSWIMLAATVSLGIQRLLMEASLWPAMTAVLVAAVLVWWTSLWWRDAAAWRRAAVQLLLVAVFLRFAVPVVILATDATYQVFMRPAYETAQEEVAFTQRRLAVLHEGDQEAMEDGGEKGVFPAIGRWFDQTTENLRVRERLASYQDLFQRLAENVVQLIAVFVLQTIILPLLFLWALLRIWKYMWSGPRRSLSQ